MHIAIIGTGEIGAAFARRLVQLGHTVAVANSHGPHTLADLVTELGTAGTASTIADAPVGADLVILAIPFGRVTELDSAPFAGTVVLDPTNYDPYRDPPDARIARGDTTSGQVVAEHLVGASVVKAFNTLWFRRLLEEGRPDADAAQRLAVPVAADDPAAKELVLRLTDELGFAPVDAGSLADSWRQEYAQPVFNQPVGHDQVRRLLAAADRRGIHDARLPGGQP